MADQGMVNGRPASDLLEAHLHDTLPDTYAAVYEPTVRDQRLDAVIVGPQGCSYCTGWLGKARSPPNHAERTFESIVGSCPGTLYHIVDSGHVNLIDVDLKLTIPPRDGYKQNDCPKNAKVMRAMRICDPPPINCGRTEGDPGDEFLAVSLID